MKEARQRNSNSWLKHTRNVFLAGIIAAIPLVVTYLLFRWLFDTLDGVFQPLVVLLVGHRLPGVGLVAVVILIYLLGLITTNVIGRQLVRWFDTFMGRMPVVQYVYTAARQAMDSLRGLQQVPFKKVVIVEFPKIGMYSLGFITGKAIEFGAKKKIPVFIPHTPNPMTGFLVMMASEDIIDTDLTIDVAMRMVLSGGLISPDSIGQPIIEPKS